MKIPQKICVLIFNSFLINERNRDIPDKEIFLKIDKDQIGISQMT